MFERSLAADPALTAPEIADPASGRFAVNRLAVSSSSFRKVKSVLISVVVVVLFAGICMLRDSHNAGTQASSTAAKHD